MAGRRDRAPGEDRGAGRGGGAPGEDRSAGRRELSFWTKLRARSRSNLYFALVVLDRERREAFRDVYRFARAADDIADASESREEALAGLATWKRELDAAYAGRATHPYAFRLARAARRFALPRRPFDDLLGALEADARGAWIARDQAELVSYCEAVSGPLAELSLAILGASGPEAARYGRGVAVGIQLANIVRDVRDDARAGRVYLPRDALEARGVSADALRNGAFPPGAGEVCRELADLSRAFIAEARGELGGAPGRELLVPEIWADTYLAALGDLERLGFDPGRARHALPRRRHKLALALGRFAAARAPGRLPSRSGVAPARPGGS